MMEKYGTDLTKLPADDDQLRIIKDLSKKTGLPYTVPENKQAAEEVIEQMEKMASGGDQ